MEQLVASCVLKGSILLVQRIVHYVQLGTLQKVMVMDHVHNVLLVPLKLHLVLLGVILVQQVKLLELEPHVLIVPLVSTLLQALMYAPIVNLVTFKLVVLRLHVVDVLLVNIPLLHLSLVMHVTQENILVLPLVAATIVQQVNTVVHLIVPLVVLVQLVK